MKKLKTNLLLIIAMVIGATTMAFELSDNRSPETANQYWFAMDAQGTTPLHPLDDVDEECPIKGLKADCARLYEESQTTGSGSTRTVIPAQINNHVDFRTRQ